MQQGATGPYLCLADDNKKYVLKRQRAGFEGCIKEWLLGNLGRSIGLPIPNCELVYVDGSLLEYSDKYQFEIGEGMAFASEHIPDLQEVNYQQLQHCAENQLQDLYVFDYWIRNADRNLTELSGNPNLFYKHSNFEMIVLDHNLACDKEFRIEDHQKLHVSSQFWPAQIDYVLQQNFEQRIRKAMNSWNDLVAAIPDDWKEGVADFDGLVAEMKLVLEQYQTQQFWEGLK